MNKIRVAICDDMQDLCEAYGELFDDFDDIAFVGYALSASDCLKLVRTEKPDVLLLDVCIELHEEGLDIIADILNISEQTKIIMLTGFQNEEYVFKAFVNGASDYVSKSLEFEDIVKAIRNAYAGKVSINADTAKMLVNKTKSMSNNTKSILYMLNKFMALTPAEYEVLRMLYYGKTYKQIAVDKVVEETTVRTLGSRILKKFEATSMKDILKDLREIHIMEYIGKDIK